MTETSGVGMKVEHTEAKGSFKFSKFRKPVEGEDDYIYFKLLSPIEFDEVKELLNLDPDQKGINDSRRIEITNIIEDAVSAVEIVSKSYYRDMEFNQVVDTCMRPHKKWSCRYFRDRAARNEKDALMSVIDADRQRGGQAPIIQPFFEISKAVYEREIKKVIAARGRQADRVAKHYQNLKATTPGLENEPDSEKIDKMALAGLTRSETDEYKLQDPDTPVSVFTDKQQREAIRLIRSQFQSRSRSTK